MTNPNSPTPVTAPADDDSDDTGGLACVLVFNASDPSGAGGLSADVSAIASGRAPMHCPL
jgi:hydroxymethylpyrimidine/phosphomethylpyrimidine kinase